MTKEVNKFAQRIIKKYNKMNKIKLLLATGLIGMTFFSASAQAKKFGHINSNDLLILMPERAAAEKVIQEEAKTLEGQLTTMSAEYRSKVQDYEAGLAKMSELVKQTKAKEITDLQQRIQDFQVSAQQELEKKESELLAPIIDKAKKAIKEVADKNGYSYVFDASTGVIVHAPEGDDLLPLVKKQLGITAEK